MYKSERLLNVAYGRKSVVENLNFVENSNIIRKSKEAALREIPMTEYFNRIIAGFKPVCLLQ